MGHLLTPSRKMSFPEIELITGLLISWPAPLPKKKKKKNKRLTTSNHNDLSITHVQLLRISVCYNCRKEIIEAFNFGRRQGEESDNCLPNVFFMSENVGHSLHADVRSVTISYYCTLG
jgi:hypothetical protein